MKPVEDDDEDASNPESDSQQKLPPEATQNNTNNGDTKDDTNDDTNNDNDFIMDPVEDDDEDDNDDDSITRELKTIAFDELEQVSLSENHFDNFSVKLHLRDVSHLKAISPQEREGEVNKFTYIRPSVFAAVYDPGDEFFKAPLDSFTKNVKEKQNRSIRVLRYNNNIELEAETFHCLLQPEENLHFNVINVIGLHLARRHSVKGNEILYLPIETSLLLGNLQVFDSINFQRGLTSIIKRWSYKILSATGKRMPSKTISYFNRIFMFVPRYNPKGEGQHWDLLVILRDKDDGTVTIENFNMFGKPGTIFLKAVADWYASETGVDINSLVLLHKRKNLNVKSNIHAILKMIILADIIFAKAKVEKYPVHVQNVTVYDNIIRWLVESITFDYVRYYGTGSSPDALDEEKYGLCFLGPYRILMLTPESKEEEKNLYQSSTPLDANIMDSVIILIRHLCVSGHNIYVALLTDLLPGPDEEFPISPPLQKELGAKKNMEHIIVPFRLCMNGRIQYIAIKCSKHGDERGKPVFSVINPNMERQTPETCEMCCSIILSINKSLGWLSEEETDNWFPNFFFGNIRNYNTDVSIVTLEPSLVQETLKCQLVSGAIVVIEIINHLMRFAPLQRHKIFPEDIRSLFIGVWKILTRACLAHIRFTNINMFPLVEDFCKVDINHAAAGSLTHKGTTHATFRVVNRPVNHWCHEIMILFGTFYGSPGLVKDCVGNDEICFVEIKQNIFKLVHPSLDLYSKTVNVLVNMENEKDVHFIVPELHVSAKPVVSVASLPPPVRSNRSFKYLKTNKKGPYSLTKQGESFITEFQHRMMHAEGRTIGEKSEKVLSLMFPDHWGKMHPLEVQKLANWKNRATKSEKAHHINSNDFASQLYALQYVASTDSWNGMVKGQSEMVTDLTNEWVNDCFDWGFIEMAMQGGGQIWKIPAGNPNMSKAPKECVTEFKIRYYQGEHKYCLTYSTASALSYLGFEEESNKLIAYADKFSLMPFDDALKGLRRLLTELLPQLGNGHWFNKKLQRSGKCKTRRPMDIRTFLVPTPFLSIAQPIGEDESAGHMVAVVDDLIFDSSSVKVLKLTKQSLDWSCGNNLKKLGIVLRYPQPKKDSNYVREVLYHWK